MSEAEVKNDVAAEAPSAEDLKAKKRTAEVNYQSFHLVKFRHFYITSSRSCHILNKFY